GERERCSRSQAHPAPAAQGIATRSLAPPAGEKERVRGLGWNSLLTRKFSRFNREFGGADPRGEKSGAGHGNRLICSCYVPRSRAPAQKIFTRRCRRRGCQSRRGGRGGPGKTT